MLVQYMIEDRMAECESDHLGCRITTRLDRVIEFQRGTFQNCNPCYVLGVTIHNGYQFCIPRVDIVDFELIVT